MYTDITFMINAFDLFVIRICRKLAEPLSRIGLFIVFFWFGALKVVGFSPASPLVQNLFEHTLIVFKFFGI